MRESLSIEMEQGLMRLLNEVLDYDSYLGDHDYQKVSIRVFNEEIVNTIKRKFKFKDYGNVYDYPTELPQPTVVDGYDLSNNFDFFQRIALSKKYNAIMMYTIDNYSIYVNILIDKQNLKKLSKKMKPILQQDSRANLFQDVDFKCVKREYIEVSDATGDSMKPADVIKKKVSKEKLVFDNESTIVQVMHDIFTFFKEETESLYNKMEIAYKRGIILYGDPGNGKSAMIREIIRRVPEITKVVINPNVHSVTKVLSALIASLNGKKAIIIIEDLDSLITDSNRSEFLNILDGVDIKSGVYFIGTTNYPDQIDPAFMNRSGRFDRTYKIENPSENTRRAFFESRKIGELLSEYKTYKDDSKPDTDEGVVELFVKYSDNLPMASLKEIMTSTQYLLAGNENMSVEEAVETIYTTIMKNKQDHLDAHENYLNDDDYHPRAVPTRRGRRFR